MVQTLIGQKIDQSQKFLENGKRVPVTKINVSDNAVLQVKTVEKDSYSAVQLGFGTKKKPTQALVGHSKKAGFDKVSFYVREVRLTDDDATPAAGESLTIDTVFKPGDIVQVSGTSKGKGFAGVVKRHNFRGGPKTHGQSDRHRAPGSIGQTTTPGRVYRGKKMAGRMGSDVVTLPNLTVLAVDAENKSLLVTGLVPGNKNAMVIITKTGTRKNFVELLEEKVKREAREAEEAAKLAQTQAEEAENTSASSAPEAAAAQSVEEVVEEKAQEEVVEEPKAEEVVTEAAAPTEEKVEEPAEVKEEEAKK